MAKALPVSCVAHVGDVAGIIWKALVEKGPLTMAKLVKAVGEPRDTVMQGLGWLAREGKVNIEDDGRNRMVSLVQQ
jgi:hypothetical protein